MIIRPQPPAQAMAAFRSTLPLFLSGPDFGSGVKLSHQSHLGGIPMVPSHSSFGGPGPWDHDWQQVFKLGLRDVKAGTGMETLKSAGWRCFAGDAPGTTVMGHCSPNAANAWKLTKVSSGDQASSALQASQDLDRQAGVPGAVSWELRFLKIPGILVDAFWLVNLAGGTDLVIVFPPDQLNPELMAQPVYDMSAFLAIAATLATARLDYFDRLGY